MVSLFKEFIERKEEKEEKKLQKLQEMHNDKKTFFGQFLKVFKKSVQDKGIFLFCGFHVSSSHYMEKALTMIPQHTSTLAVVFCAVAFTSHCITSLSEVFTARLSSMFVHGIFSCICTCRTKTCMVILCCQDVTCVLKY